MFESPLSFNADTPFSISEDGKLLYFLDKCVPRMQVTDPKLKNKIPNLRNLLKNICLDDNTIDIVYKILSAYVRKTNPLLEGVTGAAKTLGFTLAAALVGAPLWKINYSNRTSTADIFGRFVPNSAGEQKKLYEIMHSPDISGYTLGTQEIINKYRYKKGMVVFQRQISEPDVKKIIELENLQISDKPFTFVRGALPEAAYHGGWLLHDEANTSSMKTRSSLNAPLEPGRKIRLAELAMNMSIHGEGNEKVDPKFFQGMAQNDMTYAGRKEGSPDLMRRVKKYTIKSPDQKQINEMIEFLIYGNNPNTVHKGSLYKAEQVKPLFPQLGTNADLQKYFVLYSRFHHAMQANCEANVLCRNRKQKLVYTRRDIHAFLNFLANFESYNRASGETTNFQNNPTDTFLRAIDLFYTNRFILDEEDRKVVANLKLEILGVVDKEFYLEETFGRDINTIKELFENPYNDNLVFKANAETLINNISFNAAAHKTIVKNLIRDSVKAKIDPANTSSPTSAQYYASQAKQRMIDQYLPSVVETSADGRYFYIHDIKLDIMKDIPEEDRKYIPKLEDTNNLCMDEKTVKLLTNMAIGLKYDICTLVEGLPATTKTAGFNFLGANLGWPTHQVNYNGQSDAMSIIGQYVPSDETLAEVYTRIIMGDPDKIVTEETSAIVAKAKDQQRSLTQEEAQQIAALENLQIPSSSWKFLEKEYVMTMRHGHLCIQDEVNQAGSDALERTNSYSDIDRNFTLSEDQNQTFKRSDGTMHDMCRVVATCNPAEYPGKQVLSPAGINRYPLYLQINNVTAKELEQMLHYLIYGVQPALEVNGIKYKAVNQASNYPNLSRLNNTENFLKKLADFHYLLTEAVNPVMRKRKVAKEDPNFLVTRTDLVGVLKALETEEWTRRVNNSGKVEIITTNVLGSKDDRRKIIPSILEEAYLESFSDEKPKPQSDRDQVRSLLAGKGLTAQNWAFDEIEPLISGQAAVDLLTKQYQSGIETLFKGLKGINVNPANLAEWKDSSDKITEQIRAMADLGNQLTQESHRYWVETESGITKMQDRITEIRKMYEEKASFLNAKKDDIAVKVVKAQIEELDDTLSDTEANMKKFFE